MGKFEVIHIKVQSTEHHRYRRVERLARRDGREVGGGIERAGKGGVGAAYKGDGEGRELGFESGHAQREDFICGGEPDVRGEVDCGGIAAAYYIVLLFLLF